MHLSIPLGLLWVSVFPSSLAFIRRDVLSQEAFPYETGKTQTTLSQNADLVRTRQRRLRKRMVLYPSSSEIRAITLAPDRTRWDPTHLNQLKMLQQNPAQSFKGLGKDASEKDKKLNAHLENSARLSETSRMLRQAENPPTQHEQHRLQRTQSLPQLERLEHPDMIGIAHLKPHLKLQPALDYKADKFKSNSFNLGGRDGRFGMGLQQHSQAPLLGRPSSLVRERELGSYAYGDELKHERSDSFHSFDSASTSTHSSSSHSSEEREQRLHVPSRPNFASRSQRDSSYSSKEQVPASPRALPRLPPLHEDYVPGSFTNTWLRASQAHLVGLSSTHSSHRISNESEERPQTRRFGSRLKNFRNFFKCGKPGADC